MLKTRLILTLCAIAVLIALAEMFATYMLRENAARFDRVVGRDFDAIRMVNEYRARVADLESKYLSLVSRDGGQFPTENKQPFDNSRVAVEASLEKLNLLATETSFAPKETEAIQELSAAVRKYLNRFAKIFEESTRESTREDRMKLRAEILVSGYAMADQVENALNLLEASILEENRRAVANSKRALSLLWGVGALLFLGALGGYWLFSRNIIRPVNRLKASIQQVQQQNFEDILPVQSGDEIGQLASAFNDMSAELRIMKLEADEEMARLNRERSAILRGFPHPIFILGKEGSLSQANPAAISMMEGLVDENDELPRKIASRVKECVETGEEFLPEHIGEAMLLRLSEREFWYLPRIFRIHVEKDEDFDGWAVVLMDVSRVRWLDGVKSDMLGTVSHEVKTPLTSIRMILHLLAEQKTGELNGTQQKMVFSARDDCERLLETLESHLQLSRVESNREGLMLSEVEPVTLFEKVTTMPVAQAHGSKVDVDLAGARSLPKILADQSRILQVIGNFLSNAIKHSPANEPVVLKAERRGDNFIRFSVIDKGAGIPEEEQDKIFERFYQSTNADTDGSGLGLWISREIVRAHDGRIGANSVPGKTTEFYFELPLSTS